jgi:hypothetical protein
MALIVSSVVFADILRHRNVIKPPLTKAAAPVL